MSDEVVAFVASNDTTHLVPLSGTHIVVAAPMVQGTVKAAASSLVRPLRVQLDASRPLTAWRFIVLDAHGQIVYSSRGAAPDGGARSVWSGLTTGFVAGETLRFSVTALDSAGNLSTIARASTVVH